MVKTNNRQSRPFVVIAASTILAHAIFLSAQDVGPAAPNILEVDELHARRIVIEGDDGSTIIVGGGVATFDNRGLIMVDIGRTTGAAGAMTLYHAEGSRVMSLGSTQGGSGALVVHNGNGEPGVQLGVFENGGGGVFTFSINGDPAASLPPEGDAG